jgi:hypothetical protein
MPRPLATALLILAAILVGCTESGRCILDRDDEVYVPPVEGSVRVEATIDGVPAPGIGFVLSTGMRGTTGASGAGLSVAEADWDAYQRRRGTGR